MNEKVKPAILFSGMRFADTPVRQHLDKLFKAAQRAWILRLSNIPDKDPNAIMDEIGTLEGFSVVQQRDFLKDSEYKCAQYVFRRKTHEKLWTIDHDPRAFIQLFDDPVSFLPQRGYVVADTPEKGDIVGYGLVGDRHVGYEGTYLRHFGIYQGEEMVVSKFGQGHVFKHPYDRVPNSWGSHLIFFRKISQDSI